MSKGDTFGDAQCWIVLCWVPKLSFHGYCDESDAIPGSWLCK